MPGLISDGFVIDTCAIIDLWHQYPPKTFPTLWTRIEKLAREGRLICPGQVHSELRHKDDDAFEWLEKRRAMIVTKEDATLWNLAQRVVSDNPGLVDSSRTNPQADPFVIALAKSLDWAVVTSERTKGFGAVNIPSVCRRLSIPCYTLLDFFAKEGWRL